MSSRKQYAQRNRRRTGQTPRMVTQFAYDDRGNPQYRPDTPAGPDGQPIDDDTFRITRQVPNRALRRRLTSEARRASK